jgi:hypothetical protein
LFGQATDLNQSAGEWGFFKKWRNELEHGLLVLLPSIEDGLGPLVQPSLSRRIEVAEDLDFVDGALRMLQMTAAAIFAFVFCIRTEGHQEGDPSGSNAITLEKKSIGPA